MDDLSIRLDHLHLLAEAPERLSRFYGEALGMAPEHVGRELWLCAAPERRVLIGPGPAGSFGFAAYRVQSPSALAALRERLERHGVAAGNARSPLFGAQSFSVTDPDGNTMIFGHAGRPGPRGSDGRLRARLQHVAVASERLEEMLRFYTEVLGFVLSDQALDGGALSACWLRTDPEHHTMALFRPRQRGHRLDHYSYEVDDWALIRDWADHFASRGIPLAWGPGRHGPGNNLFIMIRDPDDNLVEFSAELEVIANERPAGVWPQEGRTFNKWGPAPLRT